MRRAPFALAVVLSLVVLFSPGSEVPQVAVSDKVVHLAVFALLGLTGLVAGLRPVPLAVGLVAYAGASEVLQAVLPIDRDGDVRDALADVVGGGIGLVAGVVLGGGVRRRR